jgi:hypothetical protein
VTITHTFRTSQPSRSMSTLTMHLNDQELVAGEVGKPSQVTPTARATSPRTTWTSPAVPRGMLLLAGLAAQDLLRGLF